MFKKPVPSTTEPPTQREINLVKDLIPQMEEAMLKQYAELTRRLQQQVVKRTDGKEEKKNVFSSVCNTFWRETPSLQRDEKLNFQRFKSVVSQLLKKHKVKEEGAFTKLSKHLKKVKITPYASSSEIPFPA